MLEYLQNLFINILFFFISLYNSVINYFSNQGIKYIAVYQYLDDECIDVTHNFYMDTLIPKKKLQLGEYEVHYQVDQNQYRQIFNQIEPDENLRTKIITSTDNIKSIKILSAFYQDQDILNLLQQYAGPNADFYGDNKLTLSHLKRQHQIDSIRFMDFNLSEYQISNLEDNISDKFKSH